MGASEAAGVATACSAGDGKPGEAGWEVFYHPTPGAHEEGGSAAPSGELRVIRCDVLVLGAGALGSTGILLRSRERAKEAGRPFPLSSKLGASFSGNGDQLGFAYNGNAPVNCVGESGYEPPRRIYRDVPLEEKAIPKGQPAGSALVDSGADEAAAELGAALEKSDSGPVGPCVSHVIDLRFQDELDHGLVCTCCACCSFSTRGARSFLRALSSTISRSFAPSRACGASL